MRNYDGRSLRFFLTDFRHPVCVYRQNVTTIDDAALVRCLFALFPPLLCAIHPVNNWNEVRGSKANSNPHRYLRVLCIPLYFPWEYLPGRLERNETDPVRGNADCALRKGAWQTFWEVKVKFLAGGGGEKLRRSEKESILSLLFRYLR